MRLGSSSLLLGLATLSAAQVPATLTQYLQAHPLPKSLVVSAETTFRRKDAPELESYDRKVVRLGDLNAIVPIDMLVFDTSLKQPPNLYDGLPTSDKVLYLMSTLSAAQLSKASHIGLGMADLGVEQQKVFRSILPRAVRYEKHRIGMGGEPDEVVGKGQLEDRAILGMRIRIQRQLSIELPLANGSNGVTFHRVDEQRGAPGDTVLTRENDDERSPDAAFGVTIRKVVPNAAKSGELATKGLDAIVALPRRTTLAEALARIGAVTGKEILADLRVRDRAVDYTGGSVRAGDLLDALALAVEGTYRRVENAYFLSADVEGLGARKLRLSLWQNDLQRVIRGDERKWRQSLVASGSLALVGYDEELGLAPNPTMSAAMEAPKATNSNPWISGSELTPELSAFVDRINRRPGGLKVVTDRFRPNWSMGYRFVTAEGKAFQEEPYGLGPSSLFLPEKPYPTPPAAPPMAKIRLEASHMTGLAVQASSVAEARRAVELAQRFGFGELWLQTTRPDTLKAAVDTGFPVRLIVRPWSAGADDPPAALDRSILGETAAQAAAHIARSEALEIERRPDASILSSPQPVDAEPRDVLSSFDPQWPVRRANLVSLANSPGLKGVIVAGSQPHGYESGSASARQVGYRRELTELAAMGYTSAPRLAFIRQNGIDPIDLTAREVETTIDLQPRFFGDEALGRADSSLTLEPTLRAMATMFDRWAEFAGRTNASAVEELLDALSATSLWIDLRRPSRLDFLSRSGLFVLWKKGERLPTIDPGATAPPAEFRLLLSVPLPSDALRNAMSERDLPSIVGQPNFHGGVDLGLLPSSTWEATLRRAFQSVEGTN